MLYLLPARAPPLRRPPWRQSSPPRWGEWAGARAVSRWVSRWAGCTGPPPPAPRRPPAPPCRPTRTRCSPPWHTRGKVSTLADWAWRSRGMVRTKIDVNMYCQVTNELIIFELLFFHQNVHKSLVKQSWKTYLAENLIYYQKPTSIWSILIFFVRFRYSQ